MPEKCGILPSDLYKKLVIFRNEWVIFAIKVLRKEAVHASPCHILVYDLETRAKAVA